MTDGHKTPRRDRQAPSSARHEPSAEPAGPGNGTSLGPVGHGRKASRETSDTVDASASAAVSDEELVEDLGAELEFRGDVLEDELETARAEAAECRDRALRAQAEFENYRKRITREREDERRRAGEHLVSEMLPAIDNLERAIDHTTAGGDLKHLLAGVEAVHAQLLGVLGKEGVEVIDPFGECFDPVCQQAVSQIEDAEVAEGTIVEVYQKGYALGGRVIRPAAVVVSTGGPPPPKE